MIRALLLAGLMSLNSLGVGNAQSFEDAGPLRVLEDVRYDLENLVDEGHDTELADKAEDVLSKLEDAARELSKRPADFPDAVGNIEGAIGDLEAAVKNRLLDPEAGIALMDDLAGISRALASRALTAASRRRGSRGEIQQARTDLSRGDSLRASGRRGSIGAFKRAASRYKDALSKAESSID